MKGCAIHGSILFLMALGLCIVNVSAYNVEGNGVCTCYNCSDCTDALNDNRNCYNKVKLGADITTSGTCINDPKNFNDKTFDCQGHKIGGSGSYSRYGIYLYNKQNNAIKNCVITGFYYGGIYLDRSSGNTLANNTASNNGVGIRLLLSSNNILTNNTVSNNEVGIDLTFSSRNILTNNTANNNTYYGIYLHGSNNILTNNIVSNNTNRGIYLCCGSSNNTLTNNTVSNNGVGIHLLDSSNNILTKNTASDNWDDGIYLDHLSSNNTLTSNTVSNNGYGIRLYSSKNNTLTNNVASNNGYGIYLDSSSNNILANNTMSNNGYGIYLRQYSSNNTLTNNTMSDNWVGIRLYSSSNNTFTDNTAKNNTQWDFYSEYDSINVVTNLNIGILVSFKGKDIALKNASSPASDPEGYRNIGKYINATSNSENSWLFLKVSYSDEDLNGVDESTLRIWKYNGSWHSENFYTVNGVDTDNKVVYANITSFGGVFAPLGQVTITPTPEPWKTYDKDNDGKIDDIELIAAIMDWLKDQLSDLDLIKVIIKWLES